MGIIIKPLVTEKMTNMTEATSVDKTYTRREGGKREICKVVTKNGKEQERSLRQGSTVVSYTKAACPKYGFIVRPDANKLEIKREVEALYNVTVRDVNTCIYAGKNKSRYTRSGLIKGRTNRFKKAIVTLAPGQTIDFYSNIE